MSVTPAVVEGAVMFLVVGARLVSGDSALAPLDVGLVGADAFAATRCGPFAVRFNDPCDLA